MTDATAISRRAALIGLGASSAALMSGAALAKAPMGGVHRPIAHRVGLGGFEVSTVFDGAIHLKGPYPIFGEDQFEEDVAELMAENFLPADQFEIGFTPTIVNTGEQVVMFDTGNGAVRREAGAGALRARLSTVGLTPEQVDVVVITHFHADHIGGLMEDGAPAYPNARYVVPRVEYDFWAADAQAAGNTGQLTQANVVPLAEKMTFIEDGQDVVSGITAVAAHGHTPGHTAYHIESDGKRLMLCGDACNHYVASLQRPDWHVRFDMEKDKAAQTRTRLFDMIAADKIPFTGYHMPFPAVGYAEKQDEGYRFVPVSYQMYL
ncbi:MAG: MBL fold metallo-hydrolase [Neomegalonema sp.]|nr:MBL fold metallo-hydrolase [Neomegalonema sp.]